MHLKFAAIQQIIKTPFFHETIPLNILIYVKYLRTVRDAFYAISQLVTEPPKIHNKIQCNDCHCVFGYIVHFYRRYHLPKMLQVHDALLAKVKSCVNELTMKRLKYFEYNKIELYSS
jgi:hypothetical protein